MQFMIPSAEEWTVPILPVSVIAGDGMEECSRVVDEFFHDRRSNARAGVRAEQRKQWFDKALHQELMDVMMSQAATTTLLSTMREQSISGELPPTIAVHRLLAHLTLSLSEQK
jgi:putative protein kinase ArgK-like GTPase of G3E family